MLVKNILVTGAGGQLGSELRELIGKNLRDRSAWSTGWLKGCSYFFTGSKDLDITDAEAVKSFFEENEITHCVNCAAYTAVDRAEGEAELAERINALGPQYLAEQCATQGARLIHISTDFVFDGEGNAAKEGDIVADTDGNAAKEGNAVAVGKRRPYLEDDPTNPLGAYGASKAEGEMRALAIAPECLVIRTSWLYSSFGSNFLKTMLRLGAEREELGVVADQIGAPTYARDLAKAILKLLAIEIQTEDFGIYHFCNSGQASWFEFASKIMELSGTDCRIKPITTNDYPTPAKRPKYSVLDNSKIEALIGLKVPKWEDSLRDCVNLLQI